MKSKLSSNGKEVVVENNAYAGIESFFGSSVNDRLAKSYSVV